MKINKKIILIFSVIVAIVVGVAASGLLRKSVSSPGAAREESNNEIRHYTCGMHPSVRVSPAEYKKGSTRCPICNMKLVPVYNEKAEAKAEEVYYGCGVDTYGKCPHCDLGKTDAECICGGHSFTLKGEKINCPVCGKPLKKLTRVPTDDVRPESIVGRVNLKEKQLRLAGVKTEPVRRLLLHKEIRTVGKVAYDPQLAVTQEEYLSGLKALDKMKEGGHSRDTGEGAFSG
ncbi:MAG: hypothetical protein ABIH74_05105 [Candidatus Omnitrophota bacterium]